MKPLFYCLMICLMISSCVQSNHSKKFEITEIKEFNSTPTVDIEEYNLILDPEENRKKDAEDILSIKRKWPQIMQSPSPKGFDTILSKDFTFIYNGKLLNRADYIADRTRISDWKITFVKYDNLSLQFFGDMALLTYRNHVKNENTKTKEIEIEDINWADVYIKENDKWKIKSAHVIEVKIEDVKKSNE